MNQEDIKVALQFLFSDDEPRAIFMQLPFMRDIPYVKRGIMQEIGEPDMSLANAMKYPGNKQIHFLSLFNASEAQLRGRDQEQMFYIRGDSEEASLMGKLEQHEVPDAQISLWRRMGMSAYDIYRALRVDGYEPHQCRAAIGACASMFLYLG